MGWDETSDTCFMRKTAFRFKVQTSLLSYSDLLHSNLFSFRMFKVIYTIKQVNNKSLDQTARM